MKRALSVVMVVLLLVGCVSCVSISGGEIQAPTNVSSGSQTEKPNEPDSYVSAETPAPEAEAEPSPEPVPEAGPAISETVLVDEAGVKITAKSLNADDLFGPEIKLLIENNTEQNLTFQCRNASVNGYMVETMMSVDVVGGKKANDSLTFMGSDLEECGIETIADMAFAFSVFDSETWEDYMETEQIQLRTSVADTYEYVYDDSGDVAYEGNGVKIVVKGLKEDEIWGPGIVVYIANTGSENITIQSRDVSINGFMVDALFSSDVLEGKHAIDTITFLSSDLEENEITEIESIELSFCIFDFDSWETIVDTDVVKIDF